MCPPFTYSPPVQQLEDRFDDANRRNLGRFIVAGEKGEVTIPVDGEYQNSIISEADEVEEFESIQKYYFAPADDSVHEKAEDRRELVRIPVCAVFHKFAAGTGVPHSFVGFIGQWPALPQVVVSLRWFQLTTGERLINILPLRSSCQSVSFRSREFPKRSATTSAKFVRSKVRSEIPSLLCIR
jgi:hypothetical protein